MNSGVLFFALAAVVLGVSWGDANLIPSNVVETPCVSQPKGVDNKAAWDFVFGTPGTWNIVIASKSFYWKFAEYFLNRPVIDCKEMSQMNLTARFEQGVLVMSGYNREIMKFCKPSQFQPIPLERSVFNEVSCSASSNSPVVNLTNFKIETVQVIWTDLEKTVVFGKCLNEDNRMFSIWSKEPQLDSDFIHEIRENLTSLGYTPANFHVLTDSSSC